MRKKLSGIGMLVFCLALANACFLPDVVSAKELSSVQQAEKQAKKQVSGAKIVKTEQDYEDGELVYETELSKGKKEYHLVFRASDAKLIAYEWEIDSWSVTNGNGELIGVSKAKELAKKQVPKAKITSVMKKYSDGIDVYRVKMKTASKKYELKIHARTGKVLEYKWELTTQTDKSGKYIGKEKAKAIALKKTGSGTVLKIEFDYDDGVPVYEVDIQKGLYEHELEIHAETGKILKHEKEHIYD